MSPNTTASNPLKLQMARYLGVGLFQFVLDLLLFLLFQHVGAAIVVANTASRLSAATAGYFLNRKYTFSATTAGGYSMVLRYWLFWAFMTALSSLLLLAWDALFAGRWSPGLGKFLVEAALAVLGFFISKLWVYRHAQR